MADRDEGPIADPADIGTTTGLLGYPDEMRTSGASMGNPIETPADVTGPTKQWRENSSSITSFLCFPLHISLFLCYAFIIMIVQIHRGEDSVGFEIFPPYRSRGRLSIERGRR